MLLVTNSARSVDLTAFFFFAKLLHDSFPWQRFLKFQVVSCWNIKEEHTTYKF